MDKLQTAANWAKTMGYLYGRNHPASASAFIFSKRNPADLADLLDAAPKLKVDLKNLVREAQYWPPTQYNKVCRALVDAYVKGLLDGIGDADPYRDYKTLE